jgi:hypothetical protein
MFAKAARSFYPLRPVEHTAESYELGLELRSESSALFRVHIEKAPHIIVSDCRRSAPKAMFRPPARLN